jgi:hypothetical protein
MEWSTLYLQSVTLRNEVRNEIDKEAQKLLNYLVDGLNASKIKIIFSNTVDDIFV